MDEKNVQRQSYFDRFHSSIQPLVETVPKEKAIKSD
jgi:hypothetical protein